jgi:hypothetical protein
MHYLTSVIEGCPIAGSSWNTERSVATVASLVRGLTDFGLMSFCTHCSLCPSRGCCIMLDMAPTRYDLVLVGCSPSSSGLVRSPTHA